MMLGISRGAKRRPLPAAVMAWTSVGTGTVSAHRGLRIVRPWPGRAERAGARSNVL